MNYFYVGTWEECESYNDLVVAKIGLNGTTTRWDNQIELQDGSWAIIANQNVESNLTKMNNILPLPIN